MDRSSNITNPLRMDLGALAVLFASENIASATEAMDLPFEEALLWNARLVKRRQELDRESRG